MAIVIVASSISSSSLFGLRLDSVLHSCMSTWRHNRKEIHFGILTLPEEASLYEIHCFAKELKEDFKALKRKDISLDEWKERKRAAFSEVSDSVVISVVATTIDRGKNAVQSSDNHFVSHHR